MGLAINVSSSLAVLAVFSPSTSFVYSFFNF
jgi:hypothetical protein